MHGLTCDIFYFFHRPTSYHRCQLVTGGVHLLRGLPGHHVAGLGQCHLEGITWANEAVVHEFFAEAKGGEGAMIGLFRSKNAAMRAVFSGRGSSVLMVCVPKIHADYYPNTNH